MQAILDQPNFRTLLQEIFAKHATENSDYTLKAFAEDLGLSYEQLWSTLNRKRGLSEKAAKQVAHRLKLTHGEARFFCDLVESEHARSRLKRELAAERVKNARLSEKFQKQILGKATRALREQGLGERHISSVMLAFDKSKIVDAQKLLSEFRSRFSRTVPQGSAHECRRQIQAACLDFR